VAIVICLFTAIIFKTPNASNLFYTDISIFHNPTYFAMYIIFCMAILLNRIIALADIRNRYYIILFILIIFLFLLSSKAGFVSFLLLILVVALYSILQSKRVVNAFLFIIFMMVFLFLVMNTNYRVKTFTHKLFKDLTEIRIEIASEIKADTKYNELKIRLEKLAIRNSDIRVALWFSALQTINKNLFFGVGVGDEKDELFNNSVLREKNIAIVQNYNSHNQFLDTFVSIGLIGGLILILMLFFLFYYGIKNKNLLMILFSIIISAHFLTESMLNTIAGVVFFSFFYSLISLQVREKSISSHS